MAAKNKNKKWLLAMTALMGLSSSISADAAGSATRLNQGSAWTELARREFYKLDQGSELIPYAWIAALQQANGQPFMAESLSRYGYIPNSASVRKLPIGFTVNAGGSLGMTCAACHTRQIEVGGAAYRIDGGPAIADMQRFMADLDQAVGNVLADPNAFAATARRINGGDVSPENLAALRTKIQTWYGPFHTQMVGSLPAKEWGPGRLDAVSMIFNRLAGLDIGPAPSYLIPANIAKAEAPTRYPFLWNASKQDKTQWPGFSDNGDDLFGLLRNQGEVIGVFAHFHPVNEAGKVNYSKNNSTNFAGLNRAEELIKKMGPPAWPWAVDPALAAKGKPIYDQACGAGCHEIKQGMLRVFNLFGPSWATPILNVGTDTREYGVLMREVDTGVLAGEEIPFLHKLGQRDLAFNVLQQAVYGSVMNSSAWLSGIGSGLSVLSKASSVLLGINGAFKMSLTPNAYEARVLQGVWAAAPYLHNGSVPNLVELLKPAKDRVASFKIGPAYDIEKVGLAAEQTKFDQTLETTDCSDLNSGNSRCGHEYGTTLSPDDKKALLEYLKTL